MLPQGQFYVSGGGEVVMEEDEDELTPKKELRIFLISLAFTAGGFWLLPYLDDVEKSGWGT